MKSLALQAALKSTASRYPNARGIMGRPLANANPGDLDIIKAGFEKFYAASTAETKSMREDIKALGDGMDELAQKFAGATIGGSSGGTRNASRALAPLSAFLKTGAKAAMTEGDDPSGGYTSLPEVDSFIQNQLISLSPLRGYAKVDTVGMGIGTYSFLINKRGTSSGWVDEPDARPETNTPALGKITPADGEVYANPKISQRLLDDSAWDLSAFIQENISDEFALQEGAAFVTGNGVKKPRGFLNYPVALTADAARPFGTIQYVKTGKADGFAALDVDNEVSPADAMVNLLYSLRRPYRSGAGQVAWLMNSTTAQVIRKFKDGRGDYIWQDSLQAGEPAMLLGYPVAIDENMPDIGAGAFPVAFGNWWLGYRIVDRTLGFRILRDPYTDKPNVFFYATKRVAGSVADSNAIKLLKCEA